MSINYGSSIVVTLGPNGVFASPNNLGVHRLRFSVQYRTAARPERYCARNFRAIVSVARASHPQNLRHLGTAWPESAWVVQTGQFVNAAALLFDLDVSNEQLALIEGLREAGALSFTLKLLCEVQSGVELEQGWDEIRFHVDRDAWIACMRQLGLDRVVVLEVPLPSGKGEICTAVSLLEKAREELWGGNYDGVVQKCRLAVESVQNAMKLQASIKAAVDSFACAEEKRSMNKRARALVVHEAARHYAHPALHVDANGQTFEYGRRDAAFMLALASAVVANAAGMAPV